MAKEYEVKDLKVIGYADVIRKITVPRRVAPIFETHDQRVLFPPFILKNNLVIGGTNAPMSDFEKFSGKKVTCIIPSFPAIPQGMLWIDETLALHYGNQDVENEKLYEQAAEKVRQGSRAFKSGKLEEAVKCARWACAANQKSLKPLVLGAAVYKIQEDDSAFELMEDLLNDIPDRHYFGEEVDSLVNQYNTQ